LTDSVSDLKHQILCIPDKLFPEFESLSSDIFHKSTRTLLKEGATSEELAKVGLSELIHILAPHNHGRFSLDKALDIKTKTSSPVSASQLKDGAKVQLRYLLEYLIFLRGQIKEIDTQIEPNGSKGRFPLHYSGDKQGPDCLYHC